MRTLKLTEDTKRELLGNLLNRNPGSYGEYEEIVNGIINDIRKNGRFIIIFDIIFYVLCYLKLIKD